MTGTGLFSSYSSRRDRRSYSRSPPRSRTGYSRQDNGREIYRNEYDRFDHSNGSKENHDGYYKRWNDDGKESSKSSWYFSERGREFDYRRERKYSGSSPLSASQMRSHHHDGNDRDGGGRQRERDQAVVNNPIQHAPSTISSTTINPPPSSTTTTTAMHSSQPVPSHDYSMFVTSTPPRPREEGRDGRDEGDENRESQSRDYMGYCEDRSWSDGNKEKWKEEVARRYVELEMWKDLK